MISGLYQSSYMPTLTHKAFAADCNSTLTVEAESGVITGNFVIRQDASLSGGRAVYTPDGSGTFNPANSLHRIDICITIAVADVYKIIGWTKAPDGGSNSFFMTIDNQPTTPATWTLPITTTYEPVEAPLKPTLSAGQHIISIYLREDGAEIDKIQLQGQSAPPTCNSGLTAEAESGILHAPFQIVQSSQASQGQAVQVADGFGSFGSPNLQYRVDICVTVSALATYELWGWTVAPDAGSDSFYIQLDGAPSTPAKWNLVRSTGFEANKTPLKLSLSPGQHTVSVFLREDGAQLDKIELRLTGNAANTPAPTLTPTPTATWTPAPIPTNTPVPAQGSTTGPLYVDATNPRYFSDANGQIVYLTGSHTWSNFQDNGGANPPPAFNYTAYLDFLQARNHNFFRLWTWEQSRWSVETSDDQYWFSPAPFKRTGPGVALDGLPKFDLTQFEQATFDRMRARVLEARARGIYVSIMLFNGWSINSSKGGLAAQSPWRGHPFNAANNINGINGDLNGDGSGNEVHTLDNPNITARQEAYVRKVIDTVGDLDNVLYEISNESDGNSADWQYHMITFVRQYEASKGQQHPIGMTAIYFGGSDQVLFDSPADWISPTGNYLDPLAASGQKVIVYDTDHLCGICGDQTYPWRAFLRGLNPIYMDGYDGAAYGTGGEGFAFDDPTVARLRSAMGQTLQYARRIDLGQMTPRGELASTGYALAKPGEPNAAFLVYLPAGGNVTVNLGSASNSFVVEWFHPASGQTVNGGTVNGGGEQLFTSPFNSSSSLDADVVLYLHQ
ncbi:MAG: hypothetical protein KDE54_20730 [Caldilineaceae bacterium]|nr:hypothetical protein [Caldilineaceae bacterium]